MPFLIQWQVMQKSQTVKKNEFLHFIVHITVSFYAEQDLRLYKHSLTKDFGSKARFRSLLLMQVYTIFNIFVLFLSFGVTF